MNVPNATIVRTSVFGLLYSASLGVCAPLKKSASTLALSNKKSASTLALSNKKTQMKLYEQMAMTVRIRRYSETLYFRAGFRPLDMTLKTFY